METGLVAGMESMPAIWLAVWMPWNRISLAGGAKTFHGLFPAPFGKVAEVGIIGITNGANPDFPNLFII